MREIKFRGKRIDNVNWTYGYLFKTWERCFILWGTTNGIPDMVEVIPETVGQYTGLKDKSGVEIYDGDVLRFPPKDKYEEANYCSYEVLFHDNDCCDNHIGFQMNRTHYHGALAGGCHAINKFIPRNASKMLIIGNIHEQEA